MSELVKQLLCIPATSVPAEHVFSAAGYIVSKLRAALSPENIDAQENFQYSPEDILPEEIEGWSESELSVVET